MKALLAVSISMTVFALLSTSASEGRPALGVSRAAAPARGAATEVFEDEGFVEETHERQVLDRAHGNPPIKAASNATESFSCGPWVEQTHPPTGALDLVHAIDEYVAWVAGRDGDVLRTIDGGATWETRTPETPYETAALFALDVNTCFIGHANGLIRKTTDGGLNWHEVQNVGSFINGLHFFNNHQDGWVEADPFWRVKLTIDTGPHAGNSYLAAEARFTTPIETLPNQVMSGPTIYVGNACPGDVVPPAPGPGYIALIPGAIGDVVCRFDEKAANVIDAGYEGMVIFRRESGGDQLMTMGGDPRDIPGVNVGHSTGLAIAGVASVSELVVGDPGADITAMPFGGHCFNIWNTADAGLTWTPSPTAPACTPGFWGNGFCTESVEDPLGNRIAIFGTYTEEDLPSPLYRSTDGGQSWDPIPTSFSVHLNIALNPTTGFGLLTGFGVVEDEPPAFTTDHGATWQPVQGLPPCGASYGVGLIDGTQEVFLGVLHPANPPVLDHFRSHDAGRNWEPCGLQSTYVQRFSFLDPFRNAPAENIDYTGWAVGLDSDTWTIGYIWKLQEVIGVAPFPAPAPTHLVLDVRPNPFNPLVLLEFEVPAAGQAALRIFDQTGRLVRTLGDARFEPGSHAFTWDGRDGLGSLVASGVYFAELECDEGSLTRKLVLVK